MFFDVFSKLCEEKGVSCKRAAEEMGLSNSITTKWKKTGALPDGSTLLKIAAYFGVSTDYLLGYNLLGSYIQKRRGTQEPADFAEFCGISHSQLMNLERYSIGDECKVSRSSTTTILGTDDLRRMADKLDVDFNYLACLYDGKNPHMVRGVTIPDDDITSALPKDTAVLQFHLEEKEKLQITPEDMELLRLFETASPEKKEAILALLK